MYQDDRSSTGRRIGRALLFAIGFCIVMPFVILFGLWLGKIGVVALVTALSCLWLWAGSRRQAGQLRSGSTRTGGYDEVSGPAAAADDRTLRDPLTNEPCLWFAVEIAQRRVVSRDLVWVPIRKASSSRAFVIRDAKGVCRVNPAGAVFELPVAQRVPEGSDLEHRMWRIKAGDFVSVVGQFASRAGDSDRCVQKPAGGGAFLISNKTSRRLTHEKTINSLYYLGGFFLSCLVLLASIAYRLSHA